MLLRNTAMLYLTCVSVGSPLSYGVDVVTVMLAVK